jgi:hypothetical protein
MFTYHKRHIKFVYAYEGNPHRHSDYYGFFRHQYKCTTMHEFTNLWFVNNEYTKIAYVQVR